MSIRSPGLVVHTVLGAPIEYDPHKIMKKLCSRARYSWLHTQYVGHSDREKQIMTGVVCDIYKRQSGSIPPEQARGILSLFLTGRAPSVQILVEARLLTIGPSS